MQINQEILERNVKVQEHLDMVMLAWREGRVPSDYAKTIYRSFIRNLVLTGHHDLFVDEFEYTNDHEPKRTYRRFTTDDIETLKRLYARGRTAIEISSELDRNVHTVRGVIKRLQTQKVLPARYKPRASATTNNNMRGN